MIRFKAAATLGAFTLDATFESDARVLALFGRSGAGKSVTIALIAGLMRPDQGQITVDGRVLVDTEANIFVPKHARRMGVVYQDARLFPHMTVRQNLMFGRWFAGEAHRSAPQRVGFDAVVDTLGIGHLLARRPGRLSGGERQRVAIGRALLSSPRLLLMDEPLAALDDERKREVLALIERLRDEFKVPIVYVSHAIEEVARLAARVVVLDGGRVVASGGVDEVFGPSESQAGESRFARSSVRDLSVRTALAGTVAAIEIDDGPLAAVTVTLKGGAHLVALATRMAVDELKLKGGDPVFALIKAVALDERSVSL